MHSFEFKLAHARSVGHPSPRVLDIRQNRGLLIAGGVLHVVLVLLHDLPQNYTVPLR